MFNAIVEFLKPYNEIIGVMGIVATAFFAAYFYHRAKREKIPTYVWDSIPWIEGLVGSLPGLKVLFNDAPVGRVTITKLYFWNAGRETIRRSDLTPANPLTLKIHSRALDVRIVNQTEKACRAEIGPSTSENGAATALELGFDYLDYNDGFVVQIVHDGPAPAKIAVTGKIIGAREIKFSMSMARGTSGDRYSNLHDTIVNAKSYFYLGAAILGFFSFLWGSQLVSHPADPIPWFASVVFGLLGAVSLLLAIWTPRVPRRLRG